MKNISKQICTITLTLTVGLFLASCARDLNSTTYVASDTAGIVYEGTIISSRVVTVRDSDQIGGNPGIGTLGGGLAGGIGASSIGKGTGSSVAAVGGAVLGAVIGSAIEDQLKTSQGIEYIVKLADDSLTSDSGVNDNNYTISGGQSVGDKIKGTTKTGFKSGAISIVQGIENQLAVGQKVYVIYNDDRPRIVPAI